MVSSVSSIFQFPHPNKVRPGCSDPMTEAFLFQFPHLNKVRQEAPERSHVFQFPHLSKMRWSEAG